MAIVDLGVRIIDIGGLPSTFVAFRFNPNRAYIIDCRATIEHPENIFSFLRFRTIFSNNTFSGYHGHHIIETPLTTRPFVILLPFSNLYDSGGNVIIEVERLSFNDGGGDSTGTVMLALSYDDSESVRTWL